jgi:hypothetical protein
MKPLMIPQAPVHTWSNRTPDFFSSFKRSYVTTDNIQANSKKEDQCESAVLFQQQE